MEENKYKKSNFNPIKEDTSGIQARKIVWSTNALDTALKGLNAGKRLIANPFYENNVKLLKGDLLFERTNDEKEEWKRCAQDIIHFSNTHAKLMTPEGIQHIKLRDYQEKYLKHLLEHRLSIYLACRQASKTTTSALRILHFVCFNFDKNVLVVGNKLKTSREVLDKVKKMFVELPFFLRPGILKWNEYEVAFDNGCRIMTEAAVPEPALGFTLHLVLWDEAAHVAPNIIDDFYNNIFPTITAAKAIFMITSTQNGYNLFQRLYMGAVSHENEYWAYKTDWYEVPEWNPEKRCWEKRDEAWHKLQVANYGGEEAFNRQFGTAFDSNANSLISNKKLKEVSNKSIQFEEKNLPGCQQYFVWHPDFEPSEQLKTGKYIITCDLAEGGGNDYTTFIFNEIYCDENKRIKYRTVGMYHHNDISLEKSAMWLKYICKTHMKMDNYYVSIEMNTYGELFIRYMKEMIDNDMDYDKFNMDVFLKFKKERVVNNRTKIEYKIGIRLDTKEKLYGCMNFKTKYECGEIENCCDQFINEAYNFCDEDGNNTYKASYGHDDIFMAQMQLVFFERSSVYQSFTNALKINDGQNKTMSESNNLYDMIFELFDLAQYENNMSQISPNLKRIH